MCGERGVKSSSHVSAARRASDSYAAGAWGSGVAGRGRRAGADACLGAGAPGRRGRLLGCGGVGGRTGARLLFFRRGQAREGDEGSTSQPRPSRSLAYTCSIALHTGVRATGCRQAGVDITTGVEFTPAAPRPQTARRLGRPRPLLRRTPAAHAPRACTAASTRRSSVPRGSCRRWPWPSWDGSAAPGG
eukprot:350682-Chlamydomonas_euryale.AAC.9